MEIRGMIAVRMSEIYRSVFSSDALSYAQGSPGLSYELAILIADHLNGMIAIKFLSSLLSNQADSFRPFRPMSRGEANRLIS